MSDIDKDIARCKELIKIEHSNWIGMSNQDAIENVLSELESYKGKIIHLSDEEYNKVIENAQKDIKKELETYKKANDNLLVKNTELKIGLKTLEQSNKNLLAKKTELETWKKIAEKLAYKLVYLPFDDGIFYCTTEAIIDWAKREVEKNG